MKSPSSRRSNLPRNPRADSELRRSLETALTSTGYSYTSGSTHNFYHYPARFAPAIARAVIGSLSAPGDWVLDPFMGGGTAVIEGLALGRRMLGTDLNSLAHFVTLVRTTPLTRVDGGLVRAWAAKAGAKIATGEGSVTKHDGIKNLPRSTQSALARALEELTMLPEARQRRFARCVLARLGQWALDCRESPSPGRQRLAFRLVELTEEMLEGLDDFVGLCKLGGLKTREIAQNRLLLHRSAVGLEHDPRIKAVGPRPRLVFTSPPYPGVHVLYHRWQYQGRKETAAPYWIANVQDGYFESHYTGGSRTPSGLTHYFEMITAAFKSVAALVARDGVVAQLVGFSDAVGQLPRYLAAMQEAGFEEWHPAGGQRRLGRRVPNRKWYARLQGVNDASSELLLLHRPRP